MSTLAQIRNEVTRVIGLDSTAAGADETLVDGWANEAVLDVLAETRCYVISTTINTSVGVADQDLATSILKVVDLYTTQSGTLYRLKQVSPQTIIDMRVSANAQQDSPATHYAVAGDNLLMLYPTPNAVYTITAYVVPVPTAMSSGTHDPSNTTYGGIPSRFHRAIIKYVEAEAADYRDDQTSQHGDRYRKDYDRWLGKIRKLVNQKGNTETPAFEIRGRAYPPHDPSTDVR